MQHAVAGLHLVDHAADQNADAELIDLAHVGDADAALAQQILFQSVDRADAEQFELVGIDRCARLVAQKPVEPGLAAQEGRRHSVHIAGQRGGGRIVVSMRIEPDHEELAAGFAPMTGEPVHRTHRERMIAAEKDRDRAGSRQLVGALAQRPDPALDFPIMPGVVRRRVREFGDLADREIAVILHTANRARRAGSEDPAVLSAAGPIKVPRCDAPISMGAPSSATFFIASGLETSITANPFRTSE